MQANVPFTQIVKHPAIYLLVVVISLMWFFVYKFTDTSDAVIASKDEQIKYYEKRELISAIREKELNKTIDSLQGLMLRRSDNSYEELKKMLNIKEGEKNTIIIKPKKK